MCFNLLPVQPGFLQAGWKREVCSPALELHRNPECWWGLSPSPHAHCCRCMSNCDKVPSPAAWLGAERESMDPAASLLAALFPSGAAQPRCGMSPSPHDCSGSCPPGSCLHRPPGEKPSDQHPGGLGTGCSRRGGSTILNISVYLLAFI